MQTPIEDLISDILEKRGIALKKLQSRITWIMILAILLVATTHPMMNLGIIKIILILAAIVFMAGVVMTIYVGYHHNAKNADKYFEFFGSITEGLTGPLLYLAFVLFWLTCSGAALSQFLARMASSELDGFSAISIAFSIGCGYTAIGLARSYVKSFYMADSNENN